MTKLLRSFFLLFVVAFLWGCADNTQIASGPVPDASLSRLNTFAPDRVFEGHVDVCLNASVTNAAAATFSWEVVSGPAILKTTDGAQVCFDAPAVVQSTEQQVKVSATYEGFTEERTLTIRIDPATVALNAGADFIASAGSTVSLHATGHADDGPATYQWQQVAGSSVGALTGAATENATFVAPVLGGVFTFEVTLTDAAGRSIADQVTVTVEGKKSPVLTAVGTPAGISGTRMQLEVATDAVSPTYQWQQVLGPDVTLSALDSDVVTFTAPTVSAPTRVAFRVQAVDADGLSASTYVTASIHPSTPLVLGQGVSLTVPAGSSVTLPVDVVLTPDVPSYAWTQTSGDSVVIGDDDQQNATVTLPTDQAGTYEFQVTVSADSQTQTATVSVTATVPTAVLKRTSPSLPRSSEVETGTDVHLHATITDGAAPYTYTWSLVNGPATTITPAQTDAVFTPGTDGTYTVRLSLQDALGNTTQADIDVEATTPAPKQGPVLPTSTQLVVHATAAAVQEGEKATALVSVSGASGATSILWEIVDDPTGSVSLDATTNEQVNFTAPAVTADTAVRLRVTVTDIVGPPGVSALVDVPIGDNPITLTVPPRPSVVSGGTVALSATLHGGLPPYTYSWAEDSGNPVPVTVNDADQMIAHVVAPSTDGIYNFDLQVQDAIGNSATATLSVQVLALPLAPVVTPPTQTMTAVASPPHDVLEGEIGTANVSVIGAAGTPTFDWRVSDDGGTGLSDGDLSDADTTDVRFTAPKVDKDAQVKLEVTVTDSNGTLTRPAVVNILDRKLVVSATPTPTPATVAVAVAKGHLVHLHASTSGNGKAPLSWQWQAAKSNPAGVTLNNADTANPDFSTTTNGTYSFTATVRDDLGNTASHDATVVVLADLDVDLGTSPRHGTLPDTYGEGRVTVTAHPTNGAGGPYSYRWQLSTSSVSVESANLGMEFASTDLTGASVNVQPIACVVDATCVSDSRICGSITPPPRRCAALENYLHVTVTETSTGRSHTEVVTVRWVRKTVSHTSPPVSNNTINCQNLTRLPAQDGTQYFASECSAPSFICAFRSTSPSQPSPKPCPLGSVPGVNIKNTGTGARTVEVGCVGERQPLGAAGNPLTPTLNGYTCERNWFIDSSGSDRCQRFTYGEIFTLDFECTWCCRGSYCNTPSNNGCPVANAW